jgi:spore maturation protein CgeB
MKILIADVLLAGKPNSDWKEGYVLKYAFENLGHECIVAGPHAEISEVYIPEISKNYDLVIISENYPAYSGWKWWNWSEVKIPKLFWAIDTHLVDYSPFVNGSNIDFVAFNNKCDMDKFNSNAKKIYMPYAVSKKHYDIEFNEPKKYDTTFIGGMTQDRESYINRFNIKHISAFGSDYVKEMKRSRICFNRSISHDLNAKYFEIIGSGTFMLTNKNDSFLEIVDNNESINKMIYNDDEDLRAKIDYYLKNEDEREYHAKIAKDYIFENHSFESRAKLILNNVL